MTQDQLKLPYSLYALYFIPHFLAAIIHLPLLKLPLDLLLPFPFFTYAIFSD